jgi:hypothetical protein
MKAGEDEVDLPDELWGDFGIDQSDARELKKTKRDDEEAADEKILGEKEDQNKTAKNQNNNDNIPAPECSNNNNNNNNNKNANSGNHSKKAKVTKK